MFLFVFLRFFNCLLRCIGCFNLVLCPSGLLSRHSDDVSASSNRIYRQIPLFDILPVRLFMKFPVAPNTHGHSVANISNSVPFLVLSATTPCSTVWSIISPVRPSPHSSSTIIHGAGPRSQDSPALSASRLKTSDTVQQSHLNGDRLPLRLSATLLLMRAAPNHDNDYAYPFTPHTSTSFPI